MALNFTIKGNQRMQRWIHTASKLVEDGHVANEHIATAIADGGTLGSRQITGVIRYISTNAPRYHNTARALKANFTNYYERAASGIELLVSETVAGLIFKNGTGMIARAFKASIIKPGNGHKYLTIPAIAEAYGKRAGEFGSRLKFEPRGKNLGVLVWRTPGTGSRRVRDGVNRGPAKARKARRNARSKPAAESAANRPVVVYWCVRQIKQKRDRSILPSDADIRGLVMVGCRRAVRSIAESPLALSA